MKEHEISVSTSRLVPNTSYFDYETDEATVLPPAGVQKNIRELDRRGDMRLIRLIVSEYNHDNQGARLSCDELINGILVTALRKQLRAMPWDARMLLSKAADDYSGKSPTESTWVQDVCEDQGVIRTIASKLERSQGFSLPPDLAETSTPNFSVMDQSKEYLTIYNALVE